MMFPERQIMDTVQTGLFEALSRLTPRNLSTLETDITIVYLVLLIINGSAPEIFSAFNGPKIIDYR